MPLPQPILASDFTGLALYALAILLGVTCGCLIAGALTAGVFVYVLRQRWLWWLTPLFAGVWFAIGWFTMEMFGM